MPPPAAPVKKTKKTRTKQKPAEEVPEVPPEGPLRITRSKIKMEKLSTGNVAPAPLLTLSQSGSNESLTKSNESVPSKKGSKKVSD